MYLGNLLRSKTFLLMSILMISHIGIGHAMMETKKELLSEHLSHIVGERSAGFSDKHLNEVASYIESAFKKLGYEIEHHNFELSGEKFQNIVARKKGLKSDGRIIIAAHFDSVPDSPGADDNASGVAVMLEAARILADHSWNYTVEFIGFHMEEWGMIGSEAYVQNLKKNKVAVRGMISLEMVGYTSNEPKSQNLPLGFSLFYPNVGNFIGIVSNLKSVRLLNTFKENMKSIPDLPLESLILPMNGLILPAVRLSDHSPFWDAGYQALLITDTSFYRNPNYHSSSDTIETLNIEFMKKVSDGVIKSLIALDQT